MISSLSRNLPRTTVAAASTRIRPALSTTANNLSPLRPAFLTRASFISGGPGHEVDDDDDGKERTELRVDGIADIIAAEHDLKLSESRKILATVFDTIVESVTKKETVMISGFGKFAAREVPPMSYPNPQDPKGPRISKPATTRVKFTPLKHFKDCVAGVAVVKKTKGGKDDVPPPIE